MAVSDLELPPAPADSSENRRSIQLGQSVSTGQVDVAAAQRQELPGPGGGTATRKERSESLLSESGRNHEPGKNRGGRDSFDEDDGCCCKCLGWLFDAYDEDLCCSCFGPSTEGSLLGCLMWVAVTALTVLVAFFAASEATRPLDKIYYNETAFCDSEDFFPSPDSTYKFGSKWVFYPENQRTQAWSFLEDEVVFASNCTNWFAVDNKTLFLCKDSRFRCVFAKSNYDTYYVVILWFFFAYGVISFCTIQFLTFLEGVDGARIGHQRPHALAQAKHTTRARAHALTTSA